MSKKKAWEFELEVMNGSMPVILSEEEQTWSEEFDVEAIEKRNIRLRWESHVPGSGAGSHR